MYDKITSRLSKIIVIFLTGLVTGTFIGAWLMEKDEKEDDVLEDSHPIDAVNIWDQP